MTDPPRKPLMRCIGEFFGHIIGAVRKDVTADQHDTGSRKVVESTKREERHGDVVLRETRIREVEFRSDE